MMQRPDLPLKWRNGSTIDEHVLPTFVSESLWLCHVQCQYISRIYSNLQLFIKRIKIKHQ